MGSRVTGWMDWRFGTAFALWFGTVVSPVVMHVTTTTFLALSSSEHVAENSKLYPSLQSLSRISKVSPTPSQSRYVQLPCCSARTAQASRLSCRLCTISARCLNTAGQTLTAPTSVAMPSTYALEPDAFRKIFEKIRSSYKSDDRQGAIQEAFSYLPLNERGSIIPEPDKPFIVEEEFTDTSLAVCWSMISQVLTGPLAVLLRELRGIRYLGPIRDIPPRNYRSPKTPMESCWAGGLGAWDALVRDPALVEKTGYPLKAGHPLTAMAECTLASAPARLRQGRDVGERCCTEIWP